MTLNEVTSSFINLQNNITRREIDSLLVNKSTSGKASVCVRNTLFSYIIIRKNASLPDHIPIVY